MYLEVNYTLLHTFNISLKVTSNSKAIYVCTCKHAERAMPSHTAHSYTH